MSREQRNRNGWVHWVMVCDEPDCDTESPAAHTENQLPLWEFHGQGWFIAYFYGDCCPYCVAKGRHRGRGRMPLSLLGLPSVMTAYHGLGRSNGVFIGPSGFPSI